MTSTSFNVLSLPDFWLTQVMIFFLKEALKAMEYLWFEKSAVFNISAIKWEWQFYLNSDKIFSNSSFFINTEMQFLRWVIHSGHVDCIHTVTIHNFHEVKFLCVALTSRMVPKKESPVVQITHIPHDNWPKWRKTEAVVRFPLTTPITGQRSANSWLQG